ncbi:MAG: hypothetical protein GY953_15375 [bacterium]|nr:hypothetical protein [bacterium]
MLKTIMRIFSYLYHLILGLFLLAIGTLAMFGGQTTLRLDVLPWEDPALTYWVFFGSLGGLVFLALALKGTVRLFFRLWTVVVFALMAYGFFLTKYHLGDFFLTALLLTLGALVAVAGSWTKVPQRA